PPRPRRERRARRAHPACCPGRISRGPSDRWLRSRPPRDRERNRLIGMAQTKRKRQTKHRGNAAGVVESRGRTGRKPTAAEKKGDVQRAKAQAVDRRDRPPTWRAALIKGVLAAGVLALFCP